MNKSPPEAIADVPVASPCIGVCRLDARGLCVGCLRTLGEITEWPRASTARQRQILRELIGRR